MRNKLAQLISYSLSLSTIVLLTACGGSSNTTPSPSAANSTASNSPASASQAASGKIKIAAAENFYGEVARAVGGDRVEVVSILDNPAVDPHEFEPTPDVAKTVSDSQVILYNGLGYDAWMEKLLKSSASASSKSVIKVADDLMGKKEGDNEHVWYDPETMPKLANKLADELSKMAPDQDQAFHKNAQAYIASLAPLTDRVQKLKKSDLKIDVSEPVFSYMAQALQFSINDTNFAKAIDEGTDPSPADLAQLQNDIKGKNVKLFIYNSQNSSPAVDNIVKLANSSGLPVVEVTETEPKGKNYLQWMTDELDQVGKALGK